MIKIKGVNRAVRLLALGAIILVLSFPCTGLAFAEGTGRIELVGGGVIDWPCGMPFTDPGWEAVDANGQDCSGSVESGGELCVWKLGSYTLSYSFTDIDGQPVELSRVVNVVPVELPEMTAREKVIHLTFDDGPCEYTDRVLELLDRYDAKATFFIVGNSPAEYHDRIEKIYAAGHQVGIHARDHDYGRLYSAEKYFFEDFMYMQQFLYEHTGSYATVSRFPGGSTTAFSFLGKRT